MAEPPPAKIFPRNLTARAAYRVAGNPATSRTEDAVGNCYPGLELDVRNLDRRFFPGLVFDFVARDDKFSPYTQPEIYGALLRYVDLMDPELAGESGLAPRLATALNGDPGTALSQGTWYLDWVEQAGTRISMWQDTDGQRSPLDGLWVWRIVRSLEPLRRSPDDPERPVAIGLVRRSDGHVETLTGWRRLYADEHTGVLSLAYVPGEMQQSLCSPWQHDFRDCGCHYWASNHPDVVLGEIPPGEAVLPDDAAANPLESSVLLDWLRAERGAGLDAAALDYVGRNRTFQVDHYQINHVWQDLEVVINDTEIGTVWTPTSEAAANPYGSPDELSQVLRDQLGPLEMALAIEYLYARFSVVAPQDAHGDHPTLYDDVTFLRHLLILTATSEMTHLRWVNQLLWELHQAGLVREPYRPVLEPAREIPAPNRSEGHRPRQLRPLTLEVIDDFVAVEHPSAAIDASYERVYATLRQPIYPSHLAGIAQRILENGNEHYERFLDLRRVITSTYGGDPTPPPYLRPIRPGTPEETRAAVDAYVSIRENLGRAYADDAKDDIPQSEPFILAARQSMSELLHLGETLAAAGIGIPFWSTS